MSNPSTKSLKAFCNRCKIDTNHSVKTSYNVTEFVDDDPEIGASWVSDYQVVECNGCNSVSFRKEETFAMKRSVAKATAGVVQEDYKPVVTYYPERLDYFLSEKVIGNVPINIRKAYREVLDAYNRDMPLLCASGLRTLVEGLCNSFQIKEKDATGKAVALGSRIREFATRRLIPTTLADALQAHKQLGNDAVHNLVAPDKEELKLAIGLLETAFENLFTIAKRHNELGGKMTKRMLP